MNDLISRKEAIEVISSMTVSVGGQDVLPEEGKKSVIETLDLLPGVPLNNEWIRVDDRYPEDQTIVLLAYKNIDLITIGYWDEGFAEWDGLDDMKITRPDYWMALPDAPKED